MVQVSLIPLELEHHTTALQRVYELTPSYWDMYGLLTAPERQGERDLQAIQDEAGRYGMGILLPNQTGNPQAGAQLVGLVDFRLHWPEPDVAYVGMVMVAEALQRRGIGTAAWRLLEPWMVEEAQVRRIRLGVEQFNLKGLKYFESLDFDMTGDSNRIRSGKRLVRLLYMEKDLAVNP